MRLTAEAGTDGAAVAIFDPAALPEDFDARFEQEPGDLLPELAAAGRLIHVETGGDGGYQLHLYLDEPVPEELARYCRELVEVPALPVPSGTLWFCGAEYAGRDDDQVRQATGTAGRMEIPAGTYAARLSAAEYPHGFVEAQAREALRGRPRWMLDVTGPMGCLMLLALAATIIALLSRHTAAAWLIGTAGVLIGLFLAAWTRLPLYREMERRSAEVQREYPAYVLELRSG